MRKKETEEEIEINGEKYSFLTNTSVNSDYYAEYLAEMQHGGRVYIRSPAISPEGKIMKGFVAIYIATEVYEDFVDTVIADISRLNAIIASDTGSE